MKPFAAKLASDQQFLGIGLSTEDMLRIKSGQAVGVDLASIGVGLWFKDEEGKRHFIQPRESRVVIIPGDRREDLAAFLQVSLP